jgi:hypothetical protein
MIPGFYLRVEQPVGLRHGRGERTQVSEPRVRRHAVADLSVERLRTEGVALPVGAGRSPARLSEGGRHVTLAGEPRRARDHARCWCSMGVCGNRAEAAAHYLRRRGGSIGISRVAVLRPPAGCRFASRSRVMAEAPA